jgi:hypothetical protein
MATMKEMLKKGHVKIESIGSGQYLLTKHQYDPDTGDRLPTDHLQTITVDQLMKQDAGLRDQREDIKTALGAIDKLNKPNTKKAT